MTDHSLPHPWGHTSHTNDWSRAEPFQAEQMLVDAGDPRPSASRFLKTRILAAARREARRLADQRNARFVSSILGLLVGALFLGSVADRIPEARAEPVVMTVVREARQPWASKVVPGETHEPFPGDGSEWTLAEVEYDPIERLRERWEELV